MFSRSFRTLKFYVIMMIKTMMMYQMPQENNGIDNNRVVER